MKGKLLIICVALFAIKGYTQDSIVNYLDFKYKKGPKETALYIQTVVKKGHLWQGIVYYSDGKIKYKGNYSDNKLKKRVGVFKVYDKKGRLKSIQNYNLKGRKEGVYLYFSDKGDQLTKGFFLKGKKEGVWSYVDENKNKRAKIVFKKGKVINYQLWNENGVLLEEELILYKKPIYKNGLKYFKAKLKKELTNRLKRNGLKTNFLVEFQIDKNGNIKDVSVVPELKESFKKSIINFFYNIKDVEPAILTNRKVNSHIKLPIIIK